jgi:hypothetical protein
MTYQACTLMAADLDSHRKFDPPYIYISCTQTRAGFRLVPRELRPVL